MPVVAHFEYRRWSVVCTQVDAHMQTAFKTAQRLRTLRTMNSSELGTKLRAFWIESISWSESEYDVTGPYAHMTCRSDVSLISGTAWPHVLVFRDMLLDCKQTSRRQCAA